MITFFLAAAYFLALFCGIEFISRKTGIPRELSRKLAHIISGVSAAFLPFVMPFNAIVVLSLVFLAVMLTSRKLHIFNSVHDVKRHSYGELFFPLAVGLMALLFSSKTPYIYGLLVMALGDGLAGLLGAHFGRKMYRIGSAHKSYFGSSVFFVVCLAIGWAMVPHPGMIAASLLLTLIEAVSPKGIDNLLLPLAAAVTLPLFS